MTYVEAPSCCRKYEENVLKEPIERRWVQTPDGLYDPEAVPPEWYQWLRKRRDEAPTLREIDQYAFFCFESCTAVCSKVCSFLARMECCHLWEAADCVLGHHVSSVKQHLCCRMGAHRVQIQQKAALLQAEEVKRRFQVSLKHS